MILLCSSVMNTFSKLSRFEVPNPAEGADSLVDRFRCASSVLRGPYGREQNQKMHPWAGRCCCTRAMDGADSKVMTCAFIIACNARRPR